ncbi:MAG: hypothetical protein ACEQSB_06590 [Undibacterium sp.]
MAPRKKKEYPLMESTNPAANTSETAIIPEGGKVSNADMMKALGASGTKIFGGQIYEEYNPKLAGLKGLEVYDEMRKSDAQVNACLLAIELPIRSTLWSIEAGCTVDGDDETVSDSDTEIQKFIEAALFDDMNTTWDDLIRQVLTMCTF